MCTLEIPKYEATVSRPIAAIFFTDNEQDELAQSTAFISGNDALGTGMVGEAAR